MADGKTDFTQLNRVEAGNMIIRAFNLGFMDEMNDLRRRSAEDVLDALGIHAFRGGHARGLRAAYAMGRFHCRTMGC